MQFLILTLCAAGIVAVDQFTKYLTVSNIALHQDIPFLPGVLSLTYEQNTGAAFSMLQGQQWFFALIFLVFTAALIWLYAKKVFPFTKLEWFCLAAVYGGGFGNMIDRVRFGYVIDMIQTDFMNFPIFNVADSFITCGCIVLIISLSVFNKEFWKEEKK